MTATDLQGQSQAATDNPNKDNLILDALFTQGYYEEEVELPCGHKCVLRSRKTSDVTAISELLEKEKITSMGLYNQRLSIFSLAYSLRSLDGKQLPQEFETKMKILDGMAAPLADMLLVKLVEFDNNITKIYTPEEAKN